MGEHRQVRCSEPHGFVGAHRDEFSKGSRAESLTRSKSGLHYLR
jgi:hypothetical protein